MVNPFLITEARKFYYRDINHVRMRTMTVTWN
jgi:hypothetical protein